MLQMMRNQKFIKTAMWIVIIAFVSWLGLELGYGGGPGGANPEVGEVEGTPIKWVEYRRQVAQMRQYQRQQANMVSDEFDLDEQVWQQSVRRILVTQAIDRMGIVVTPGEVAEEMVASPPSGFERVPDFQDESGAFDPGKYRQFLSTISQARWFQITGVSFAEYEGQVHFDLQVRKLNSHIQDGAWVTEARLRQAYADQNERAKVRVVAAPVSLVPDSLVEVPDGEVRAYYQSHLDEYSQRARAELTYVVIPKTPSKADSSRVLAEVTDIHSRLLRGEDFAELARQFSEDQVSAQEGGSLGTFGRGSMVSEFDSAAFAMSEGQISRPVHTQFGWHIVKVERRVRGETSNADSVEARHILVRDNEPGIETLDSLMALGEDLAAAGAAFDARARERGLTPQTTDWFDREVVFPMPLVRRPMRRLVRWAFVGEIGAVASPSVLDDQIVVARLADRREAGPRPFDEVRDAIAATLRQGKRVDIAAEWLAPVAARVAAGQSLEQAVEGTDFDVIEVGPFTRSQYLPEVKAGSMDGFIGAAFSLTLPGQTTGLVKVDERGAYIMTLVGRTLDESGYEGQREGLRARFGRRQQQSVFADWDRYARENADIVDHRDRFYTYN